MEIKNYRTITKQEKEEINRLASNLYPLLKIDNNESNSTILQKMKEFVENLKIINNEELEKFAFELGSLFGNIICKEYGWEWHNITTPDNQLYCVSSPKNKACCICHNYFYSILNKSHSNNFTLLFNMIEKNYPKNWNFMVLS